MSGLLRIYESVTVEVGGDVVGGLGSLNNPVEKTVGDDVSDGKRITLAPGESAVLWIYSEAEPRFDLFVLDVLSGSLYVAWRTDAPTDLDADPPDYSPAETAIRWRHLGKGCIGQLRFDTDLVPGHATNTSETAGTETLPALWADAGLVLHKIYAIVVLCPEDAEESAVFRRMWVSKDA